MNEFLYDTSSTAICALLFLSMLLAIEVGHYFGRRRASFVDEAKRKHVDNIQASLLGLLALVIAFTFSIAVSRYDSRSEAIVEEANALGTTWLRAQLLPDPARGEALQGLRDYARLRTEHSIVSTASHEEYRAAVAQAEAAQLGLWAIARRAVELDPSPVRTGLFVQSLNETIDNFGRLDAAIKRHVPEFALWVLYGTVVLAYAVVGYASGIAAHRVSLVGYILAFLIVVLVFVILDLDRPRRGLIEVSNRPLVDVYQMMSKPTAAQAVPPAGGA